METARDAIDNNPCVANCRLRKRRISRIHISPVGHIESCVRLNNAPVSTRSVDRFPLPDDAIGSTAILFIKIWNELQELCQRIAAQRVRGCPAGCMT
jgi:hypothetical protein